MALPRSSVQLAVLCFGLLCSVVYFLSSTTSSVPYAPAGLKNRLPGFQAPTLNASTPLEEDSQPAAPSNPSAYGIEEPANDPIWNIKNATLGFQKIYAISMPSRTDKRDYLALMGLVSGLEIEFADGVNGSEMHPRAFPSVRLKTLQPIRKH